MCGTVRYRAIAWQRQPGNSTMVKYTAIHLQYTAWYCSALPCSSRTLRTDCIVDGTEKPLASVLPSLLLPELESSGGSRCRIRCGQTDIADKYQNLRTHNVRYTLKLGKTTQIDAPLPPSLDHRLHRKRSPTTRRLKSPMDRSETRT